MRRLYLSNYTYKPGLDEDDFRKLVKTFGEIGLDEGVVAHYERLDGKGGALIMEVPSDENAEKAFERVLLYSPFIEFEVLPVTPFEDALPTVLKLYS